MDQAEERALARARRPRDEYELPAFDDERHATEHRLIGPVALEDLLEDQDRSSCGRCVVPMPLPERLPERAMKVGRGHRLVPTSPMKSGKLFDPAWWRRHL